MGWIPGLGTSLGEGKSILLQHSCLENSIDRGAWQVTEHGVQKSQTQLSMHADTPTTNSRLMKHKYILILNTFPWENL